MKKIKLTRLKESSTDLTPFEKMALFNSGRRRENLRACALHKLKMYYHICLDNSFDHAAGKIEEELRVREETICLLPCWKAIGPAVFTPELARFILRHKDNPKDIVTVAKRSPLYHFTESDTLFVFLVLAMAMGLDDVVVTIRKEMAFIGTFYKQIPKILPAFLERPDMLRFITAVINEL